MGVNTMQVNMKLVVVASLLVLTTWGEVPAQDQSWITHDGHISQRPVR